MKLKTIFYTLIAIFVILLLYFITQVEKRIYFPIIAILGITYGVLGIYLAIKGRKNKYLLTIGISAAATPIGAILHNFFYALGILSENMPVLAWIFEVLHGTIFIIAMLIAPIIFIIMSIITIKKRKFNK